MLIGDAIQWATKKLGIKPCPACEARRDFLNGLQATLTGRVRVSDDGTIMHPQRGTPPSEVPEGYYRDPKNPFLFRLLLPSCTHQESGTVDTPCCGPVDMAVCGKYKRRTDALSCLNCIKNEGNS